MAEKKPMWTDELDELTPGELVTKELYPRLTNGAAVRVVTPAGVVYEGEVHGSLGRNMQSNSSIHVNGVPFVLTQHDIYLIDPERMTVRNPAAVQLSDEEVRDYIADMGRANRDGGKPSAVSPEEIARRITRFDPTIYSRAGEQSTDTAYNPFFKLGALRRTIKRLCEEGVLRKVTSGSYNHPSDDDKRVKISGKVGYVTAEQYEDGERLHAEATRTALLKEFRIQAVETVAARHQDEVEAEIARLLAEAGQ